MLIAVAVLSASAFAQKSENVFICDVPLGSTVEEFNAAFQQAGYKKSSNIFSGKLNDETAIEFEIKRAKEWNEPVQWIHMTVYYKIRFWLDKPDYSLYCELANHFIKL